MDVIFKKYMKIAVLFFGQPRFFDITKSFIKDEFTFEGHTTDYFAHLWENIGYTPDGIEQIEVDSTANILSDYFSAKNYKIENYEYITKLTESFKTVFDILKNETNQNIPLSTLNDEVRYKFSQHYSTEQAFYLLKEYEKEHNFKYDLVIKARTDIVYSGRDLYKDNNEYYEYKNKAYFDITTYSPAVKCNGLRIIKLNDTDSQNIVWDDQFVYSFNNKEIKFTEDVENKRLGLSFDFTWNNRLAFNDWCLIANRSAAEIMFSGWYTSYIQALGLDIDRNLHCMLKDKTYLKKKPKFISNSEHTLQGFMVYKNNINTRRINPHRRDYRLLNRNEIKKDVISDGKILARCADDIPGGIRKIFNTRYPTFLKNNV